MKNLLLFVLTINSINCIYAQGIINNGANIIIDNNAEIIIAGTQGNFKNQNNGLLIGGTTGGKLIVQGDWENNASNTVFSNSSNDNIEVELVSNNIQTIGGSNQTDFPSLKLSGTSNKKLYNSISVGGQNQKTGSLTFNANELLLNNNQLTITNPNASGIVRTSGYIVSDTNITNNNNIVNWEIANTGIYVYPFGLSGDYLPVSINKTESSANTISIATRSTLMNNLPLYQGQPSSVNSYMMNDVIDRWWDINMTSNNPVNMTLSYRGNENTTQTPTGALEAFRWDGNSFIPLGTVGVGVGVGVGTVNLNTVSGSGNFLITTAPTPLSVDLVKLSANCVNNKIQINWATINETNSSYFRLERSRDLSLWEEVTVVTSTNQIGQLVEYSVNDSLFINATNYYRLSEIDNDGQIEYFNVVSVDCEKLNTEKYYLYPNPTKDQFSLVSISDKEFSANIILSDMTGKILEEREVNIVNGTNSFNFNASGFELGVYLVTITSNNEIKSVIRLVKD